MLNKKAIAALAAGATLVSGLAFATPAMADPDWNNIVTVAPDKSAEIANAEKELKEAKSELADKQSEVPALKRAAEKDQEASDDAYAAFMKFPEAERKEAKAKPQSDAGKAYTKYTTAADKSAASKKTLDGKNKEVEAAQKKVNEKQEALNKLKGVKPVEPKPVDPKTPKLDLVNLLKGVDEPSGATMVSPFGTSTLYTNYKGLTAELIKKGITNIAAYDALLDKLEFGLKQTGWANILKNMGGDNCNYLGQLRRQLQKAVKHYGHVEAAVKDIQAELNEDYKDAKASENWDAAKVIKGKLAQAAGLYEVAHHNRTRAAAILDSANDHAKDLSCDTGAKEVLDAMKKAGNFPGKKTADKKAAPAGAKLDTKTAAAAVAKSAALPKTGVAVMVTALAASMLAGIGAAVRKFRH
ncbi:hypothetical protein [Gardnerella vaginalis]|uniref:hypothetical protein n=1 Tax=Gardnerella vaginalis TaxID=2702 RepID=UPI0039EF0258